MNKYDIIIVTREQRTNKLAIGLNIDAQINHILSHKPDCGYACDAHADDDVFLRC